MSVSIDRNLLFGVLAVEMELIDGGQLADGLQSWLERKDDSFGQVLVARGILDDRSCKAVDRLVDDQVQGVVLVADAKPVIGDLSSQLLLAHEHLVHTPLLDRLLIGPDFAVCFGGLSWSFGQNKELQDEFSFPSCHIEHAFVTEELIEITANIWDTGAVWRSQVQQESGGFDFGFRHGMDCLVVMGW